MKWHIYYIEGCESKLKSFKTMAAARRFLEQFKTTEDDEIGLIIYGQIIHRNYWIEVGKKRK